jgi:8-oxo-dGTP pyrophosphatase MutT (NUDIX family)
MSQASKAPVPARPASTVVILRDGADGIEVFMVVRHHEIDFASGALVFPGGKVDAQDSEDGWADLAVGMATPPDASFFVAAARESFEEAGLLLAREQGSQAMVGADRTHRLVEAHRGDVLAGRRSFLDMLRSERLVLAGDLMLPFAHWITPDLVPKRFDTHFLLIAAPVEQVGQHDGDESTDGLWIRPQQALDDAKAGTKTLVFATEMNLRKLAGFATVAAATAATRASRVVTVTPRVEKTATGRTLHIPAEAGYGITEYAVVKR